MPIDRKFIVIGTITAVALALIIIVYLWSKKSSGSNVPSSCDPACKTGYTCDQVSGN